MARQSRFPVAEVEREKGVIIEEMNTYHHSPRDCVGENFDALLYGDRPLGWAIIGTRETVEDADRARLVEYRRQWYTASRLVVGVAGAIDGPVRDRVEQLLGDLEPGDGGFQPAVVDSGPRVVIEERVSDQAEIALGAPSFRLDHPDEYVGAVIAALLGGGMSSRLYTELRDQRGLGYRVTTVHQQYSDAGSIWAQAGVAAEKIDEAIAATVREFSGLTAEPVPANELEKARNLAKGQFVFKTETPQGLMNHAITRELSNGRTPTRPLSPPDSESVSADDVQLLRASSSVPMPFASPSSARSTIPGRFEGLLGDLGKAHGVRPDPIASRVLTTILFTDVVASTERHARSAMPDGHGCFSSITSPSDVSSAASRARRSIPRATDSWLFDAPLVQSGALLAICVASNRSSSSCEPAYTPARSSGPAAARRAGSPFTSERASPRTRHRVRRS